jgi:glutamate carboxypeptidase
MPMAVRDLVERMTARQPAMVKALRELVEVDSPSGDPTTLARAASRVSRQGAELLGEPPTVLERDGILHLRWGPERARILLLGHYDTVWPTGTAERRPPEERGGRLFGPGAFDMKAGIVQGWFALRELGRRADVAMLLTGDEERGSPTSSALVEAHAGAAAALVLEPSVGGALKTARHGVSQYQLTVHGRAAHAGLDPGRGVNAFVELAAQVQRIVAGFARLGDVIVTPGVARAGHAANVVPDLATCTLDIRARTTAAQRAADALLHNLEPDDPRARLELMLLSRCPPFESARSAALFELAGSVANRLGLPEPKGAEVAGGSDGNRTAALGIPTLDGLGAVGDGAHADDEHVVLDEMPGRTALVAGLLEALAPGPDGAAPVNHRSGEARATEAAGRARGARPGHRAEGRRAR